MSLSNQVIDVFDDMGGQLLSKIVVEAPSLMKTAQVINRDQARALDNDLFALRMMTKEGNYLRKFPICSSADTWLSTAYFQKTAHKLPIPAARIAATHLKQACAKYSLPTTPTIETLALDKADTNYFVENASMSKTASAYEFVQEEGEKYALRGKYPLFTPEYVKKAAAYFVDYFGQFEPEDRHAYAVNVMNRAEELGVTLEGDEVAALRKVAGASYGDILPTQIRLRAELVQHSPEMTEALQKVASLKERTSPSKFVAVLAQFDKEAGLARHYGRFIADPYVATYDKRFTKESGYSWEDESSGLSISGKELAVAVEDKYDTIKGYFGPTLADSLKKHGHAIFDSLPVDAKVVITKIAKGKL